MLPDGSAPTTMFRPAFKIKPLTPSFILQGNDGVSRIAENGEPKVWTQAEEKTERKNSNASSKSAAALGFKLLTTT
jgi:hypothetical protein